MRRRKFITVTTGTAVAATTASTVPHRVGMADVDRLTAQLAAVVAEDNRHGGTVALEDRAAGLARQALELQQRGSASQRVRGHLYAAAASFRCSAMWAAIDARHLESAQRHLHQAVTLAGLSSDSTVQCRVWGHAGILYRQLGRPTDAMAAAEAARAARVNRHDPLYASLTHARMAVQHADAGDVTAVRRSLARAREALRRADPAAPRPPWMGFYDQAELELLALTAHSTLGRWGDAEAHAHRHLALLRPTLVRNRALSHAHLAHAQLAQGEAELAVATAGAVPADFAHRGGRVGHLIDRFGDRLRATAPGSAPARAWADLSHARRRSPT